MAENYSRPETTNSMQYLGMDTVSTPDRMPPGKYPYAANARAYKNGEIVGRLQASQNPLFVSVRGFPIRSLKRMNDTTPLGPSQGYSIFAEEGDADLGQTGKLLVWNSTIGLVDTALTLSGQRIAMVSYRPNQSVQPWMYVADSLAMVKVNAMAAVKTWGIPEPQSPAMAEINAFDQYSLLQNFESASDWKLAGLGVSQATRTGGINIATILYDFGTSGFASVITSPTTGANLAANCTVYPNGDLTKPIFVDKGTAAPGNSTLAIITYDAGTTGLAWIYLSGAPPPTVAPDQVYLINSGGGTQEYVRVLAINNGLPSTFGIRVKTVFTHVPGETMTGVAAWRMNIPPGVLVGAALDNNYIDFNAAVSAGENSAYTLLPTGQGRMQNRVVQSTDVLHLLCQVSNNARIVEVDITFNLDPTTIDFITNALVAKFLAASFTASGTWLDITIPVSSLTRVGTNTALSLATGIQGIQVTVTNSGGAVDLLISDLVIVGNYGPNGAGSNAPLLYYYTYFDNTVGAESNPSPIMRAGVVDNSLSVNVQGQGTTIAGVTTLNFYRIGGTLGNATFVGSAPNVANQTVNFTDMLDDLSVAQNPLLAFDNFEPFPSIDLPYTGQVNVVGTQVTLAGVGPLFNLRWLGGTIVTLNGIDYHLYNRPQSTSSLTLLEAAGTQFNVTMTINQPILAKQLMTSVWGPTDNAGYFFGCGDLLRPGTLYFTKGNNPDSAPDTNQIELTGPDEALINGCITNGFSLVFSGKRAWLMYPNFATAVATILGIQGQVFQPWETITDRGLFARDGLAVDGGGTVYYIAYDSIRKSVGGNGSQSITDKDIRNLFPHEGEPLPAPVSIAGQTVRPPDFTRPQDMQLRFCDGFLYFDYKDVNSVNCTLCYDPVIDGWTVDIYNMPISTIQPATAHTENVQPALGTILGGANGAVTLMVSDVNTTEGQQCTVVSPAVGSGDFRAISHFGDAYFEAIVAADSPGPVSNTVIISPYINRYTAAVPFIWQLLAGSLAGILQFFIRETTNLGNELFAKDLGILVSWNLNPTNRLKGWQPSLIPQPETTEQRVTDWDDCGYVGAKWIQGVIIQADSGGIPKNFRIQNGDNHGSFAPAEGPLAFNGQTAVAFSLATPFIAHTVRIVPFDSTDWRIFKVQYIYRPFPESAVNWETELISHGLKGWQHIKEINVAYISTAQSTLILTTDAGTNVAVVLPSTAGQQKKTLFPLPVNKFKLVSYQVLGQGTSTVTVFKEDIEVLVGQWGREDSYQLLRPFGGESQAGAEV